MGATINRKGIADDMFKYFFPRSPLPDDSSQIEVNLAAQYTHFMRSVFFIASLLMAISGTVLARVVVAPTIGGSSAGIKAGSRTPTPSASNVTAIKAGLNVQKRVTPHFYLNPGLFYSIYGYKAQVMRVDVQYRYTTAELPLYFLLKTGMPCKPRLVLGAGVLAAMMVNSVAVSESGSSAISGKGISAGLGLTAGIELPMGLFLSGSYQRMKNDNDYGPAKAPKLYQYSLSVGYMINKVSRKG